MTAHEPYEGPIYWLWSFDPQDGHVVVTHNEDRPAAQHVTHKDLAPEITHPGRLNGFAYHIEGGYRITDAESHKIDDPFVVEQVRKALNQEHPHTQKNHPRYHGQP